MEWRVHRPSSWRIWMEWQLPSVLHAHLWVTIWLTSWFGGIQFEDLSCYAPCLFTPWDIKRSRCPFRWVWSGTRTWDRASGSQCDGRGGGVDVARLRHARRWDSRVVRLSAFRCVPFRQSQPIKAECAFAALHHQLPDSLRSQKGNTDPPCS